MILSDKKWIKLSKRWAYALKRVQSLEAKGVVGKVKSDAILKLKALEKALDLSEGVKTEKLKKDKDLPKLESHILQKASFLHKKLVKKAKGVLNNL